VLTQRGTRTPMSGAAADDSQPSGYAGRVTTNRQPGAWFDTAT